MNYPKVLVISHNPFSKKQNNGKTLSAFFEGWPKDKIAQLFLTLDEIDTDICNNFYRISDIDVLKFILHKNAKIGKQVDCNNIEIVNEEKGKESKNRFYVIVRNLARRKSLIIWWLRTIAWKMAKPWKREEFNNWLMRFQPDIIFFQSSSFYPIYNMVEYIMEKTQSKLYIETTDDYVTPTFTLNIFEFFQGKKMEKEYKKLVNKSECIFAIGDKMAKEYQRRFNGKYKIAMNSIQIDDKVIDYNINSREDCIFTYAGNLGLKRWKILYNLGKVLDELNEENHTRNKLIICSLNNPKKKVIKRFESINAIEFKGALNSEELVELRNKTDILVHVESFDKKNKKITRLSVSTKIPEYILSKRCILSIGPKDIASIEYIKDNNLGMVISNRRAKRWKNDIAKIINDKKLRMEYIEKAYYKAKQNHMYDKNKEKVQAELLKIMKDKED